MIASSVALLSAGVVGVAGAAPAAKVPSCFGKRATISAPGNGRHVMGSKHNDVIVALGSGDVINGGAGNDLICAGAAKLVDGGAGNDKISMSGNGTVRGDAGNDTIVLGRGNAKAYGDAGNDVVTGGQGNQRLDGGAGNDRITGGTKGHFTLVGGAGNDVLVVKNGGDSVDGGAGADSIVIPSKWLSSTSYVKDPADTLNGKPEQQPTGGGSATAGATAPPPAAPVVAPQLSASLAYDGSTGLVDSTITSVVGEGLDVDMFQPDFQLPAGDAVASWSLSFGDAGAAHSGVGAPPRSVQHGYVSAGRFHAVLTVTDTAHVTATATADIDVAAAPTLAAVDTTAGQASVAIDFSGTHASSSAVLTDYLIDWGDGSPEAVGNPAAPVAGFNEHKYREPGTYDVYVDVTDDHGGNTSKQLTHSYADGNTHAHLVVENGVGGTEPAPSSPLVTATGVMVYFLSDTSIVDSGTVHATLDFGDGTTSSPDVADISNGVQVHPYTKAGSYRPRWW